MSLTTDQVQRIADLAMLNLSETELSKTKDELNVILAYVEKLNSIETHGVVPTSHVHGVVNAFREDVSKESLPIEEVKAIAPEMSETGFKVPKII